MKQRTNLRNLPKILKKWMKRWNNLLCSKAHKGKWNHSSFHTHRYTYAAYTPYLLMKSTAAKSHQSCPTLCDPIDGSPPGSRPWDSPGKNTGVGCHFLLQYMKVKSESEVSQLCPTLRNPMDCGLPGSSIHGTFQARVLEWGAIASSFPHQLSILIDLKIGGFHLLKTFTHKIRRLKNYEASEETNNLKEENQGKKFETKSSHWNRRNLGNYISCFLNTHIYIFNKTSANGATEKYSRIIVKCFESSYF